MSDLSDSLRYHDTDHLMDMVGMDATLVSTLGKAADRLDALEAELQALRDGIQKHRDSFTGNEGDIVLEDEQLWKLL